MTEIIKQYKNEAKALRSRIGELQRQLRVEPCCETAKNLRIRVLLLERERFEILRDIREMEAYLEPVGTDYSYTNVF